MMKTALFLLFFTVSVAFGAVEIEHVTFGFNEGYKTGTWAPLTITVRGEDAFATSIGIPGQRIAETYLAVEVRSFSSNTPTQRYATPLTGSQRKNFYIYCPKNATELVIELAPARQSGNTVSQDKMRRVMQEIALPTPIARKDYFVLVLAPSGDKLKRFIDKKPLAAHNDAQVHVVSRSNPTSLPRDWIGYSAVDVLVIREIVLTERRISKTQQRAILDWVQRGGTLIVSGGSNYKYLRHSFIEPFLPVELKAPEQTYIIPTALHKQLGFESLGSNEVMFERIPFSPKPGCEVLIGTDDQIYIAKRNFGEGQILCLAFDYNAPPFSISAKKEQQVGETFWSGLLSRHGKSQRHLTDRYALALQHEEKIYQQFLSTSVKSGSTQVPLIKLLAIVLPIYLLSFGGFLFYFGRSLKSRDHDHRDGVLQQKRQARLYWIGGLLFVLLSLSTIAVARNVLPNSVTADQLSILSVYPDRNRAHLQSYVSVRATAHAETSIDFIKGNFIRHQKTESPQKIGTLVQNSGIHLRGMPVEPWHPTTYVQETFLDAQELPRILENAWHVTDKKMTYLGNVTLDSRGEVTLPLPLKSRDGVLQQTAVLRRRVTPALPPDEGLRGTRKWFARILRQEQVLRHLAEKRGTQPLPYLIGWTSQGFTNNVNTNSETLVIFRPTTGL